MRKKKFFFLHSLHILYFLRLFGSSRVKNLVYLLLFHVYLCKVDHFEDWEMLFTTSLMRCWCWQACGGEMSCFISVFFPCILCLKVSTARLFHFWYDVCWELRIPSSHFWGSEMFEMKFDLPTQTYANVIKYFKLKAHFSPDTQQ